MAAARALWMLCLLTLVVPGGGALPFALLDDAGSGGDAGATPASAMSLDYGSYHANLTPDDTDWFAFPATSLGSCVDVAVATASALDVAIAIDGDEVVSGLPSESGLFAVTVALPAGVPALGVRPDAFPWDAASVGPYSFDITTSGPGGAFDELATESDGPGTIARSDPLPAACFSGYFHHDGQDVDVVSFAAGAGEMVTLSLATATGEGAATLVDGAATPLAPTISAGEGTQVLLSEGGQYFLVLEGVSAPEKYAYTVALAVGPPGQGCRPMCIDL